MNPKSQKRPRLAKLDAAAKCGNRSTCLRLDEGGPVLGLLPSAKFDTGSVELEPGDLLVLYSDGSVEAANQHDEQFGEERVQALVAQHRHLTAAQIRDQPDSLTAMDGHILPVLERVRDASQ